MPKAIANDWFLEVDSIDLSDHVQSITPNRSRDEIDTTAMGATVREFQPGIADFELAVTFFNDYAASSVWATLEAVFDDPTTAVTVSWRPDKSAAVSATNPTYSMSAKLYGLTHGGAVNEAETMDVTFRNADPAGITKAIS